MLPLLFLFGFDHQHSAWDAVLRAHVTPGAVAYSAIGPSALDPYLAELAAVDLRELNEIEKKALWLNAYNALTVDLVASNPGIRSIQDLDGGKVWDTRTFTVGGQALTLNDIEHRQLRPMGDARVHAALNCASKGCPPLAGAAFTPEGLQDQLELAARVWVRTNAVKVDQQARVVQLNRIFEWYGQDFLRDYGVQRGDIPGVDGTQEAAIHFVSVYIGPTVAAWLRAGGYTVVYMDYDWSLNGG